MRIIAGRHRGRRLVAPRGRRTRPTAERVREAAFDLVLHGEAAIELEGARVADVFAGSGAFACEALSRGAAHAVCLDRSPLAVAAIAANAKSLAAEAALTALCRDARRPGPPPPAAAAGCALAFFDPPYGGGLLNPALTALADHGWLAAGALAVAETAARESLAPPARFTLVKERRYGDTRIAILRWRGDEANAG